MHPLSIFRYLNKNKNNNTINNIKLKENNTQISKNTEEGQNKNLIVINSENDLIKCHITPKGQKICKDGGWLSYLKRIEEEKQLEQEILEQKKRIINKRMQWLSVTNLFHKVSKA